MPDDNHPTATPGVGDDMREKAIEGFIAGGISALKEEK